MNQYGQIARDHWARWLPARYAMIQDPDSFFSGLGKRTEHRIDGLADELAGDDRAGEGYLVKAGRLGEARHRAEQLVLREDILLDPEPEADEEDSTPEQHQPRGLEYLYSEDSPET
jgi:hypothetical protein